jgi:hypothetical protein
MLYTNTTFENGNDAYAAFCAAVGRGEITDCGLPVTQDGDRSKYIGGRQAQDAVGDDTAEVYVLYHILNGRNVYMAHSARTQRYAIVA